MASELRYRARAIRGNASFYRQALGPTAAMAAWTMVIASRFCGALRPTSDASARNVAGRRRPSRRRLASPFAVSRPSRQPRPMCVRRALSPSRERFVAQWARSFALPASRVGRAADRSVERHGRRCRAAASRLPPADLGQRMLFAATASAASAREHLSKVKNKQQPPGGDHARSFLG